MNSFSWAMAVVAMVVGFAAAASAQELSVATEGQGRFLRMDSRRVLELSSPWVATAGYASLYRFPAGGSAGEARSKADSGEYGKWTETITPAAGAVTIRYEFDMPANEKAAHVQWVWRLEPGQWNGILAEGAEGSVGQPEQAVALHPLEGLRIANLKRMDFVLADADLSVTCRAADGEWSFQDARSASWAKCYRLEYNRDYEVNGKRSGWFEVTIKAKRAANPLVALTEGQAFEGRGMKFAVGPLRDQIGTPLGALVILHTASEGVARGKAGGAISPALPFEVDITGLVNVPSEGNRLEVRVKDDSHFGVPRNDVAWRNLRHWIPRGMGAHNRKGLYQSVSLRAKPVVRIDDVRVQTSVRKRELAIVYTVHNTGKETVRTRIESSVRRVAGGDAVLSLPAAEVDVPGYVTASVTVRGASDGAELWQPDHPTLYDLRSLLMEGEKRLERVDTRFGFREVWFEASNFYLNGIRCNLRGESPAYSEKADLMKSREAAEEMIRRYQTVNFNVLRFHSMPAPTYVLDACDEMGMLVIDESAIYASWGMLMPEHPQWMENCREHLTKWVRRDRNHPAVVLWSAENEGLNVNGLTPGQLAEFRKMIDAEDGTRPVIFDGDGKAMGASPASVKHYVSTVADLKNPGGASSGYARDLRKDIYWATAFAQDFPLGCGEFLFPYEPGQRDKEKECCYMMGLQTRGYRLANWFDIRPYNPSYCGFLKPEGVRPGYEAVYDVVAKSFAPVPVLDKAYDELGPFPAPTVLAAKQTVTRELIVYNDTFAGEMVEVEWVARQGGARVAGEKLSRKIPLGDHVVIPISFTPDAAGKLELDLITRKGGKEMFRDTRVFEVR